MTSEDALESLHTYFAPLSELQFTRGEVNVLYTPKSPVLGVNCAYGYSPEADAFFVGKYAPSLFLLPETQVLELFKPGSRGSFALEQTLRVGHYSPLSELEPKSYQVEQVPWTRAGTAAEILAVAWLDNSWSEMLTRWLSKTLEHNRDYLLLLAYPLEDSKPVGTALVQLSSPVRVHLWGVLGECRDALNALLDASSRLNGAAQTVETSAPSSWPLTLVNELELGYWHG